MYNKTKQKNNALFEESLTGWNLKIVSHFIAFWKWKPTKINNWLSLGCNKKGSSSLNLRAMFTHAWTLYVCTFNTSLLVPAVNEQVPGALWEPRQGYKLNEAGNGVTGKEILPAGLAAQNLPINKSSRGSLWMCRHAALLCTLVMKGPRASFELSHHVGLCVPEPDHLSQHDPERRENSWRQGDGAAQVLGCTFPKVHGLHVHAYSCYEEREKKICPVCTFFFLKSPKFLRK